MGQEREPYINLQPDKGNDELVDEEVKEILAEDQDLAYGSEKLKRELAQHTEDTPELAAGDVDAAWEDADKTGEETVGGTTPTPGQDVVDEVGKAAGITYSDFEPLHTDDKLANRESNRWELNPASDPEYQDRIKQEFTPEPPRNQTRSAPRTNPKQRQPAKPARKAAQKRTAKAKPASRPRATTRAKTTRAKTTRKSKSHR